MEKESTEGSDQVVIERQEKQEFLKLEIIGKGYNTVDFA